MNAHHDQHSPARKFCSLEYGPKDTSLPKPNMAAMEVDKPLIQTERNFRGCNLHLNKQIAEPPQSFIPPPWMTHPFHRGPRTSRKLELNLPELKTNENFGKKTSFPGNSAGDLFGMVK